MYNPYYNQSWALIIGINKYKNAPPLNCACNDADAMVSILTQELGFKTENVVLLQDDAADKATILKEYSRFSEKADNPDDRLLIFFAGHGTTVPGKRGDVGFLVPFDGNSDDSNSLIRWSDLTVNAELIPAKHILFIMDACYSGIACQRSLSSGQRRFLSDLLERPSWQVIAAGKAEQTVADGGGPLGENSIFTGYLLDGLRGAAKDENGILTANGLMSYVYNKVGQDNLSEQTPHYGHLYGDGDFIFCVPEEENLYKAPKQKYSIQPIEDRPEKIQKVSAETERCFLDSSGYGNISDSNFGNNQFTEKLIEIREWPNKPAEKTRAKSWLGLILEVEDFQSEIDLLTASRKPETLDYGSNIYSKRFKEPENHRTTADSIIFYDEYGSDPEYWLRFLRIFRNGMMEYTEGATLFYVDKDGDRLFLYIQIIGVIWQFINYIRYLFSARGFSGDVRLYINLVGTKDTYLVDFGEGWFAPEITRPGEYVQDKKCIDQNIQFGLPLNLNNLNDQIIQDIIVDVAKKFALAYNHGSKLLCFNLHAPLFPEFPWKKYFNNRP